MRILFVQQVGWNDLKKRHNIICDKISGEAAEDQRQVLNNGLMKSGLKQKEKNAEEDIFNFEEMGIFYKLTPD